MAEYKLTKDAVTGEELPFILLGEGTYIPKNTVMTYITYGTYTTYVTNDT